MLIYGNTPRDIRQMIWKKKFKLLTIIAVIVIALMLMGCSIGNRKVSPPLQALDKFWDTLGSGKDKTKQNSTGVE
jgi:hypothetical protein